MISQPIFSDNTPIAFGEKGSRVQWVQERLKFFGYPIKVDGQFGSRTLESLKAFQYMKGLEPDGLVGTKTGPALAKSASLSSAAASSSTVTEKKDNSLMWILGGAALFFLSSGRKRK